MALAGSARTEEPSGAAASNPDAEKPAAERCSEIAEPA
jgi:hypothetical protein